jgi:hypothetical protein
MPFATFFKDLGGHVYDFRNDESELLNENTAFYLPITVYPELNSPVTVDEIMLAVKSLKRSKSYGCDNLLNEYYIEFVDILAVRLCKLFNNIIDSDVYPESWSLGIIIPLHKKSSITDVNNYRGITLASCLSKLCTSAINKIFESICNENNIISDAQFGFQKGRSIIDAIYFVVFSSEMLVLHVIFVDMMK